MGREELALALKAKGAAEARAIWQRAEAAVEQYRTERQQEVARHCRNCDQKIEQSANLECRQLAWRLTRQTRKIRLQTLRDLDRRLQQLAIAELSQLPAAARQQCLAHLVAEIPPADWRMVRCHPEDCQAVEQAFAACQVAPDTKLAGGLVVATAEESIQVDNSLVTRLQTRWPEMVGKMIFELEDSDASFVAKTAE